MLLKCASTKLNSYIEIHCTLGELLHSYMDLWHFTTFGGLKMPFILHMQCTLEYWRKPNSAETLRGNCVEVVLNNNEIKWPSAMIRYHLILIRWKLESRASFILSAMPHTVATSTWKMKPDKGWKMPLPTLILLCQDWGKQQSTQVINFSRSIILSF